MVDYWRELIAKKSCKYEESGSSEHLLLFAAVVFFFSFHYYFCFLYFLITPVLSRFMTVHLFRLIMQEHALKADDCCKFLHFKEKRL